MIQYSLGFLFSEDLQKVALIKKDRPEWQVGKLNGIGGKLEECETYLDAMIREFKEETGVEITDWKSFSFLKNKDGQVEVFMSVSDKIFDVKTQGTETIYVISIHDIMYHNIVSNLRWLIPLALDKDKIQSEVNYL